MLGFKDAFWEDPRVLGGSTYQQGPNVLFENLERGAQQCEDLISFMKDRALIEEQYSLSLRELSERLLAKDKGANDEGATLKRAFDGLLKETFTLSDIHAKISNDLNYDTVRILKIFSAEHKGIVSTEIGKMKASLTKLQVDKKHVQAAKSAYDQAVQQADKIATEFIASNPEAHVGAVLNTKSSTENDFQIEVRNSLDLPESEKQSPQSQPALKENKGEASATVSSQRFTQADLNSHLSHQSTPDTNKPMIVFGPLAISTQEFSEILTISRSALPAHSIKYGLLGTLRGLIRGDELFRWWRSYLPENSYTLADVMEVCQCLVDQGYLRYMGKGSKFASSSGAYYQWKKQALEFSPGSELKGSVKNTPEIELLVSTTLPPPQSTNIIKPTSFNRKSSWLLGNQNNMSSLEKAENKARNTDENLRDLIFKFERNRTLVEEDLMEFFEMMEAWELNRIANIKSAIHQYNDITSEAIPKLLNLFDRQKVYEETIKPERDIKFIVENYGVGKFWPSPMLYHPRGSLITDYQVFGVPLSDQLKVSKKSEPLFVAKSLSAITKMSKALPKDEAYSAWKPNYDLRKVHALRAEINKKPRITLKFLRQYDLKLIVDTLILYLLELPDCVCTTDLNEPIKALYAIKYDDISERSKSLSSLLSSLYPANLTTLQAIVKMVRSVTSDDKDEERKSNFISLVSIKLGSIILRPNSSSIRFAHDSHFQKFFSDLVLNYTEILENVKSEAKVVPVQLNYDPSLYGIEAVKKARDSSRAVSSETSFLNARNLINEVRNSFNIRDSSSATQMQAESEATDSDNDVLSSLRNGLDFLSGKFKIKSKDTLHENSMTEQQKKSHKAANILFDKQVEIDTPATVSSSSQFQHKKVSDENEPDDKDIFASNDTPVVGLGIESKFNSLDLGSISDETDSDFHKNVDENELVDRLEDAADKILATIDDENEEYNLSENPDKPIKNATSIRKPSDPADRRDSSDMDFFLHDDDDEDDEVDDEDSNQRNPNN